MPDCVKRANVAVGWKEIFARTHRATRKLTSVQRLIVTTMMHTAVEPLGLRPDGAIKQDFLPDLKTSTVF